MKKIVYLVLISVVGIGLAYGAWVIKRKINYAWEYRAQVQAQIDESLELIKIEHKKLDKQIVMIKDLQRIFKVELKGLKDSKVKCDITSTKICD